MNTDSGI